MMRVRRGERSNTFCGPAALSLITGKHVDECVEDVHALWRNSFVSGGRRRAVRGMSNSEMHYALLRSGYYAKPVPTALCGTGAKPTIARFVRWLKRQPHWHPKKLWLVNVTGHYVVVRGIKLFDNHNPEGVFFGKYAHRRVRVKHAWEIVRRQP